MKRGDRYTWAQNGEKLYVEITATDYADYDTGMPCIEVRDLIAGHAYVVLASRFQENSEPAYVAEPDPAIDLSQLPISGDWTPYVKLFTESPLRTDSPLRTVAAPKLCPRINFNAPKHPRCSKQLTDYKCPQHGLIREVMPK